MSEDGPTKSLPPDEAESTDPMAKLTHNVAEVLATLQNMNERQQAFEAKVEERLTALEAKSHDTKPIWERALAEIAETRKEMNTKFRNLDRKFDQLARELFEMRTSISELDSRVADLEGTQS